MRCPRACSPACARAGLCPGGSNRSGTGPTPRAPPSWSRSLSWSPSSPGARGGREILPLRVRMCLATRPRGCSRSATSSLLFGGPSCRTSSSSPLLLAACFICFAWVPELCFSALPSGAVSMICRFLYFAAIMLPFLSGAQDTDQPESAEPSNGHRHIHHSSSSAKDRVAVGGSVHVKEGETVKDVVVVGGSAVVEGKVMGDIVVVFGKATLGPKAYISHDLTVVMGALDADPDATIKGEQHVVMPNHFSFPRGLKWLPEWVHDGLMMGRPLPHQHRWAWVIAGIFLALYLLIALLFPGAIRASMSTLETRPGSSLLTGLLAILLVGPLLVLLLITVIGSILIPFLVCGGIAAYFFGKVVVYGYTGRQLCGHR